MRLGVDFNILNQKGTPAFYSDIFANRPAAGFAGRVFISTDTGAIYEDTGSAWTLIADAGAGTTGTLQQVTTNGNTTTNGLVVTAGNVAIGTATAGAPLDIHGTGTNAQFNGTGTNNAYLQFQNAGTSKWRIGNTYAAGANNFDLYNNGLTSTALSFNVTTNAATFNNSVTATAHITSGGTAAQFLKGNGSLDSNTYLPTTGSITTGYIPKVLQSGGNFYITDSSISDNGSSQVTISNRALSVSGSTIGVIGTAASIQMQIQNSTATTGRQWYLNSKSTGILGIGNDSATDVLTFANAGNATFLQGIRTTGTADQQLWVYGSSPSLRLYDNATTPTINGFVGMSTAANNFIQGSASGDMAIGTSTGGKILFGTTSGTVSPQMTILNSGNVGIGTSSPVVKFQVKTATDINLGIQTGTADTTGVKFNAFNDAGSANVPMELNGSIMILKTGESERMRITSGGNLLVGTTTDNGSKLQVAGNIVLNNSTQINTSTTVTTSAVNVGSGTGLGIGAFYFAAWYNNSGGAQGNAVLMARGSTLTTISISDGSGAVVVFSVSSGVLRAATTTGSVTMGVTQINI